MSKKKKTGPGGPPVKDKVLIKWVARANQWCRTTITGTAQRQEWFDKKPE